MIYSMTGFSVLSAELAWGSVSWELKSVNQRYLEFNFRLPEPFRRLEFSLRELLRSRFNRGKIDCYLQIRLTQSVENTIEINQNLVQSLYQMSQELRSEFADLSPLSVNNILQWPGVVLTNKEPDEAWLASLLQLFHQAIDELLISREREGAALVLLIQQRLQSLRELLGIIRQHAPEVEHQYQQRLQQRFQEASLTVDPTRLEQELLILAQRLDISEECDRLETHINECDRLLTQSNQVVGRRLDFLMQEMNREANTLASKSLHGAISHAAIDIKVLIEQIREQGLNIE